MSRNTRIKAMFAAVIAPTLLAACASGFEAKYPITQQIAPDQALTAFDGPLLQNAAVQHVSHLGAFEHVEYGRYENQTLVMEYVYDVSTSVRTVLEYDYWLTKMVDTWNVNNGKSKTWGPSAKVNAWHGVIDLQAYRLVASNRNCFAFDSDWDYQPRDPFGRPNRVFFGYVCALPGKSLAEAEVAKLLGSVRFDQRPVESLIPVDGRASVDQVAFSAAKGSADAETGNAEFPFNFGRVYFEGGPERSG